MNRFRVLTLIFYAPEIMETTEKMQTSDVMIAITEEDYQKHGCPYCGCASSYRQPFGYMGGGKAEVICHECKGEFTRVLNDDGRAQERLSKGRVGINITQKDGMTVSVKDYTTGETYWRSPILIQHPRFGKPSHPYVREDKRPSDGVGEFWNPRGATDLDCSGFVESKQAGERLLDMVKKVLGVEKPHTWLDYREDESDWIQFKVSAKEFDVVKMEEMAEAMAKARPDKRCILNEEILIACKK